MYALMESESQLCATVGIYQNICPSRGTLCPNSFSLSNQEGFLMKKQRLKSHVTVPLL
jgi:hypothetical protein